MQIGNFGNEQAGNPAQDALEHLVVEQLRDLIALEKALQKKYAGLQTTARSSAKAAFEADVLQLNNRADRLHRMMDAMTA